MNSLHVLRWKSQLELVRREQARRSFLPFIQYVFPEYLVNWHHQLIAELLEKWRTHEIRRLMIFAPPRHGKSEMVSRKLPAYILGRNPNAQVLLCSYASSLATSLAMKAQETMDSDPYKILFPGTRLWTRGCEVAKGSVKRTADYAELIGARGYLRAAGVGRGITGTGFTHGIIDDPIKDDEEAYSPTIRDSTDAWYRGTFYTRQAPQASILIMLTRWHRDDLAGRRLRAMQEDPTADKWVVLNLEAIKGDGNMLCDYRPTQAG